jgi:hypothetical protein
MRRALLVKRPRLLIGPGLPPATTTTPFSFASASSSKAADDNPAGNGLARQVIDYAATLAAEADEQQKKQQGATTSDAADARRRALDALGAVAPALAGASTPRCAVLLAASEARAWLGEWRGAARDASEALGAVAASDGALLPVAALAAVRAALIAGEDAAAAAAVSPAALLLLPGLADLAAGTVDPSSEAAGEAPSEEGRHPLGLLSRGRRLAAAAMRAAESEGGDAKAAALAAAPHADAALAPLDACARLSELRASEAADSVPLLPCLAARLWREAAADARVAQAQAHAAARRWPEAEAALSRAVEAGEAAAGGDARSPGLAAPLVLLGDVYARTARVMYAEGMYREAARLAGVEAAGIGSGGRGGGGGGGAAEEDGGGAEAAAGPRAVHPSLGALVAWRYAQLLTALPRRETEARAWAAAAERLWRGRGGCGGGGASSSAAAAGANAEAGGLASALGALDCRTGRSAAREGGVVSLLGRRLLRVELPR